MPIDIKPYRLLTSLFDKPQIGPVILDGILGDVFRTLYLSCLHQQKHKNSAARCVSFNGDLISLKIDDNGLNKQFVGKHCTELVKNANLLFNTLQSYYIWSYIEKLFVESVKEIKSYKHRDRYQVNEIGSGPLHILEICILTDFLLDIIPIESCTESTSNILPSLFIKIIATIKLNLQELNYQEITYSLQLCTKILTKIQPVTVIDLSKIEVDENDSSTNFKTFLETTVIEEKVESADLKTLEKSKSDSKINENLHFDKSSLNVDESSRERSYSNQMLKKKDKYSPKIEKKAKNKKSKSSSKLYELKKDETSESLSSENASPEKEPVFVKEVAEPVSRLTRIENKHLMKCLEEYKKFYVHFIKVKILPSIDIKSFFHSLICDRNERINDLTNVLNYRLQEDVNNFTPIDFNSVLNNCSTLILPNVASENVSHYEKSMSIASNLLLEFSAFSNKLGNPTEKHIPLWLEALIVAACCKDSSREIQITAMNTLLEVFSLAKNQNVSKKEESNTNIVITGVLDLQHVKYIEESTVVIEVSCFIC